MRNPRDPGREDGGPKELKELPEVGVVPAEPRSLVSISMGQTAKDLSARASVAKLMIHNTY